MTTILLLWVGFAVGFFAGACWTTICDKGSIWE
jgi:hypothetical protein